MMSIISPLFMTSGGKVYSTNYLYFSNSTSPYTPATFKGSWTTTTSAAEKKLTSSPAGASGSTTFTVSTGNNFTRLITRFVSDPLAASLSTSGMTIDFCIGGNQTLSTETYLRIYMYLTTGESDTNRGTLINYTGSVNLTNASARGYAVSGQGLSTVSASVGDRIVVEFGMNYFTGTTPDLTLYYGNTGGTRLSDGSTNVTTEPGWLYFSRQLLL